MSRVGRTAGSVAVVVALVAPIGFVAGCGGGDVSCVVDDILVIEAKKKPKTKTTEHVDDVEIECVDTSEPASSTSAE